MQSETRKKEWRFRPIGIDSDLADRQLNKPLLISDFLKNHNSVIFVKISDINFSDRKGYDISNPPSGAEIIKRVVKYWQLKRYLDSWIATPADSPSLLVGVTGRPGAQMVIAALEIDRDKWGLVEIEKEGRIEIPRKDDNIDVDHLRGCRIDSSVGLKFGQFKSQIFKILHKDHSFS